MESLILGRSQPGGKSISVVALMDGLAWSDVPKGMESEIASFDDVVTKRVELAHPWPVTRMANPPRA